MTCFIKRGLVIKDVKESQPEKLDLRRINSCYTSLLKSLFREWVEEPHYLAYERPSHEQKRLYYWNSMYFRMYVADFQTLYEPK